MRSPRKQISDIRSRVTYRLRRRRDVQETERIYRESDPQENKRVAFPSDERILWPCMWMTELYAPSHATSLIEGLTELERGVRAIFASQEEPSAWIQRARSWSSGWWNVGLFVNDELAETSREEVGLPDTFKEATIELVQLAPGITVLVMQFMLAGAPSVALEKVMRRTMETRAIPLRRGGQRIHGPYHRKESEIAEARSKIRGDARRWIQDRLPGLFSSLSGSDPPAWDLLLSEKEQLCCDRLDWEEAWRGPIGLSAIRDQWVADEMKGFRLVQPNSPESGAVPSLVAIRTDAEALLAHPGTGKGVRSIAAQVDRQITDLLALWTLNKALGAHDSQFAVIRDQLGAPPQWRTSKRLRRLRQEVMPLALDLQTLGRGSENDFALTRLFRRGGADFILTSSDGQPKMHAVRKTEVSLWGHLRERIEERGKTVAEQGRDISEALRAQGEVLLATTNIRLQWLVAILTLLVGAAGVVAAIEG